MGFKECYESFSEDFGYLEEVIIKNLKAFTVIIQFILLSDQLRKKNPIKIINSTYLLISVLQLKTQRLIKSP